MHYSSSMTLGDLEKRVMDVFWQDGTVAALAVRDVLDRVNTSTKTTYAYNTILTVVTHLFEKKMLERTSLGKAFAYTARISKEEHVGRTSDELFLNMQKEYGALAVAHFARCLEQVDPKILEEAKRIIAEEN